MRRNMTRRGNMNSGGAPGGPLLTNHLQDIDMELELLKRKREMIEQQQQLLVMEQQFQSTRHSFDQMRYEEPDHHGSNRDFAHLYESGPKQRNQFGRKRQAENQWQYETSPKRAPARKKNQYQSPFNQPGLGSTGSANFRNQRAQPGPNQGSKNSPRGPAPLMDVKIKQSVGQRIANQKAPVKPPNKDFAPSKVSKPKALAAPNKLASHNAAERKALVNAAIESSDVDVSRMLLPDRTPTQQVSGRLELALGAIMKNVRALIDNMPQHSSNATVLRSIQVQRVMKQVVRERIRTVMLGKVVGSLLDILEVYREEFPEETDVDILNIALEAGGVPAPEKKSEVKFIESGDPERFFKMNMSSLIEKELNEMFSKLEEIYGQEPASDAENAQLDIDLQNRVANELQKENPEEYKDFLNSTIKVGEVKRILPRLMKRYLPYMVKLMNVNAIYQSTKSAITVKANQKASNISVKTGPEQGQGDATTPAATTDAPAGNRPMYNLPYYVKIMGRPSLPKRKVMQGFLSQFNPKSIKKHRTIHNLLFVGFTEKADFDVMVGADGTVIGRSTLSVRVCSKGPQAPTGENDGNNDTTSTNGISQDESKNNESKDGETISINSELDSQITDLLSAIRKTEEEEDANIKLEGENTEENADNNGSEDKMQTETEQNEHNVEENKTDQDVQNEKVLNENADNADEGEGCDEVADDKQEDHGEENILLQEEEGSNENEAQNLEPANETETQNAESSNSNAENSEVIENNESNSQEADQEKNQEASEKTPMETEDQSDDKVAELKTNATGRSTPSRMSARLANVTPSTIRTRRASKLQQN